MTNPAYINPPSFGFNVYTSSDKVSGIYVCRQKPSLPVFSPFLDCEYKIGVSDDILKRIENAKNDSAFLFEEVDLIESFHFYNTDLEVIEKQLHTCLEAARLEKQVGEYRPREWFFVPFRIIVEAVAKVREGTIENYRYNPETRYLHYL